ncbi:unnamed protein product [Ixodes hexagonus]
MMRRQRVLRDRLNPFEDFDEDGLQQRFRFGCAGIVFLADTLRPDLERRTRRSRALSAEQQVIIALQFYATGNFLVTAGDYIRVRVSSASRAVRRVTLALARRARDFIRWPDAAEGSALQQRFYEMAGFSLVVGAVDGTYVRIQAPHVHEEAYVNRHLYHSINVQVVVDAFFLAFATWLQDGLGAPTTLGFLPRAPCQSSWPVATTTACCLVIAATPVNHG